VLIGSTIIDVGVDVPSLGMVILAGGGKAEVALRQRVGRGLREKKSGPNIALVCDFVDPGNKHTKGHSMTRRAIIEATPGFREGILPNGKDFDFVGLGFERLLSIAA
jgi:superfamily II DNA or RNA helicase